MRFFLKFLLAVTLCGVPSYVAAAPDVIRHLERIPFPSLNPPRVREVTLENGLTCFLLEDHTLPMVSVLVLTRAGNIYVDPKKWGLGAMTAELMLRGGTKAMMPEEFETKVQELGLELTHHILQEWSETKLRVLSDEWQPGVRLLFDMLLYPRFDGNRLTVVRNKIRETLRRQEDDPEDIADRAFLKLVYGEKSPWAADPSPQTIRRIERDDIISFHRNYFVPRNMILAISGDFQSDNVITELNHLTAGVPNDPPIFPTLPPVVPHFSPAEKVIERPVTQSFIRLGHLGISRTNPDKYAVTIMNDILGAPTFKSRLMEDIRAKRGLAYHVSSNFSPGKDLGVFVINVATKSSSSDEVIELLRQHTERMAHAAEVRDDELSFSKRSVLSQLIFNFETPFKVVSQQAGYRFLGYPLDYWRIFSDHISNVGLDDVKRVAKNYLHPDALRLVVVGANAQQHLP